MYLKFLYFLFQSRNFKVTNQFNIILAEFKYSATEKGGLDFRRKNMKIFFYILFKYSGAERGELDFRRKNLKIFFYVLFKYSAAE